ncbi:MAG: hypothetical protein ACON5B_00495 [Myxococcota bacterium]
MSPVRWLCLLLATSCTYGGPSDAYCESLSTPDLAECYPQVFEDFSACRQSACDPLDLAILQGWQVCMCENKDATECDVLLDDLLPACLSEISAR